MPSRWLIAALIAVSLLAGLHFWALADFWYWKYRWFDTPMHILGGAAIGIFAVSLLRSYRPFFYLAIILAASLGWELFEYSAGVTRPGIDYDWDTAHDLLNDAIGAILVYVIARFTLWAPEKQP